MLPKNKNQVRLPENQKQVRLPEHQQEISLPETFPKRLRLGIHPEIEQLNMKEKSWYFINGATHSSLRSVTIISSSSAQGLEKVRDRTFISFIDPVSVYGF